jgi:hypothetical protein
MRVGFFRRFRFARTAIICCAIACAPILSACMTVQGGPNRLYTVQQEADAADGVVKRFTTYYEDQKIDDDRRRFYRNEIIARRMYIIDVQYSEYEAALTGERQKFGFATSTAASALGIAGTLTTPIRSAQIITGVGTGILAARGFYDSEIVIAKTIQIAQGQMRALRDEKARVIQAKILLPTQAYPLSSALHDLEDYYRAGTLTAGLIKAAGEAGVAAEIAAQAKDSIYAGVYAVDDSSDRLQKYITFGGKPNVARIRTLNGLLVEMGVNWDVRQIIDVVGAASIRQQLIEYARRRGINI